MDIYFHGLTSVRLRGRKTTLVIDPFDKEKTGIRYEKIDSDAVLFTEVNSSKMSLQQVANFRVVIAGPGEYEIGGVGIVGIKLGQLTTYYIKIDGIAFLHLGSLAKSLTDSDLDTYPNIDVVFVPASRGMADFIAKLEPKIVVPIHYTKGSEQTVSQFASELGKEGIKPQPKLSLTKEKLPQEMELVWLS